MVIHKQSARKVNKYVMIEDGVDVIDLGAPRGVNPTAPLGSRRRHPQYLPNPRLLENGVDVIDLGAPRGVSPTTRLGSRRRPPQYLPNPRIYPNPKTSSDGKKRVKRKSGHRKKRYFARPVPNSRLYRPQPARRASPPPCPRCWPPPTRTLQATDTASRAALNLQLALSRPPPPNSRRQLVVTLPQFSSHQLDSLVDSSPKMEAANRHSTSPECSDGNDASSAPSEFLAEFLSAIMRRQYAEALKYCHLILQYEPHNATARGFYPLLQHKVQTNQNKTDEASSSDDSPRVGLFAECDLKREEVMQQEADSPRSSSCSSLELDSSDAPRSSRSPSPSRRTPTDRTDRSDRTDRTDRTDRSDSTSSRWDSGGERSDRDDNGNSPPAPVTANVSVTASTPILSDFTTGDVEKADENDNASPNRYIPTHLKSGSSLQRLRAQFACSIK